MPSSTGSVERLDANIPGAFPDGNSSRQSLQDVTSTHQTLSQSLYARRAEFTRPRSVRIKVGSWNVGAQKGTEKDIGEWFVEGKGIEASLGGLGIKDTGNDSKERVSEQEARRTKYASTVPTGDSASVPSNEEIGIYALGLQEVVDITSATEALRPYTDPAAANRYKEAIVKAMPDGYQLVAEQQLIGLLLLVYASPAVYPHVTAISTTSVGTGLMGYMGNKGATTARIILGETTRLVFINSHLAAGADKVSLERRNWDAGQIISRTRFDPITDAFGVTQAHGEGLGEEDFAFWFGDLNYRLEGMSGDDVRRLLTIHTKDFDLEPEDDVNAPSISSSRSDASKMSSTSSEAGAQFVPEPTELDPSSLQATLQSLLPHDELQQQQKARKAFQDGWTEGPIRFLPTYKFDIGKVGVFDSSEKRRCPSWCDRILYRTRTGKQRYDASMKELEEAKKKDEEMKAKGLDHAADDDEVLFDYDPETDGDTGDYDEYDETADPEPEAITTKEGFSDEILLEYYTSHMRVLSSDHKPLGAVFSLKFDAVIPELKAAIHKEVARELDRQENEGRPSITVVVDRSTGTAAPENNNTTDSDFDGVDFGDVQFAKSKRRNITIANTGRVPATFGFTDRPVGEGQPAGPYPSWLHVSFDRESYKPEKVQADKLAADNIQTSFVLEPAEVLNIELKMKIESIDLVRKLNDGVTNLEDILVMRVHDGRDHFLPLRGHWQQSVLARTIDKLVKIPEGGVRKLQHQKPSSEASVQSSAAPRELFRLTEAIESLNERTLAEWDMTGHETEKAPWRHNAGWPFVKDPRYFADGAHEDTLAHVYEALDCETPFEAAFDLESAPMQRLEILAEVLLVFLRSLEDGVVTEVMWRQLEEGLITREKSKQQLPADDERLFVLEIIAGAPSHNVCFVLITTMLQRIANDIANASKVEKKTPRSSIDLPASPQVSIRRRTLSKVTEVATRQLINRNYASIFTDAIFRAPNVDKMKEKDKTTRKERMIRILDLFLADPHEG
ncbi:Endonuclease/exonuclease/phosphatase [Lophiotrema nucula]|uniref:Endonuclease/exonuclease/phosphatase n=1 Tax=Lophiotrema nucula TaxID=690887 RepID=A0A6A5YKL5_9PLEO|nr:Endonuclease/exonuclease/phosphatase [Lophiotrema nucula]